MRSIRFRLPMLLAALALVSACTNKGLGVDTVGTTIGQARGTKAILFQPQDRSGPLTFSGTTLDGQTLRASDFAGAVTVVNFWASWCGPCRAEPDVLERAWRDWKGRGVRFLGINIRDTKVDAGAFVDEYNVTYPSIFNPDASIAARFRLTVPPSTFVLDERGRIAGRITGAVSEASVLDSLLTKVLA